MLSVFQRSSSVFTRLKFLNLQSSPAALPLATKANDSSDEEPVSKLSSEELHKQPPTGEGTYDEMKEAARKTGDPAKEWLSGPASAVPGSVTSVGRDDLYESTKRAVEESTPDARSHRSFSEAVGSVKEASQAAGFSKKVSEAAAAGWGDKVKDKLSSAADTLDSKLEGVKGAISSVGESSKERPGAMSARAEWEQTRSPEQRKAVDSSRKAQLTDEAFGDNPKEAIPRYEKQTEEHRPSGGGV